MPGAVVLEKSHVGRQRLMEDGPPTPRPLSGQIGLAARGLAQLSPLLLDETLVKVGPAR